MGLDNKQMEFALFVLIVISMFAAVGVGGYVALACFEFGVRFCRNKHPIVPPSFLLLTSVAAVVFIAFFWLNPMLAPGGMENAAVVFLVPAQFLFGFGMFGMVVFGSLAAGVCSELF